MYYEGTLTQIYGLKLQNLGICIKYANLIIWMSMNSYTIKHKRMKIQNVFSS